MDKNKKGTGQVFDEQENMPTCNADELFAFDEENPPEVDYFGEGKAWWRCGNAYTDNGYLEDVSEQTAREMGYLSAVSLEQNREWMSGDELEELQNEPSYDLEDEIVARMDRENEEK